MNAFDRLIIKALRVILRTLCVIDDTQVQRIPAHGPLILVSNHINFLDTPVYYTHLLPRQMTAFAKEENWEIPILKHFFAAAGAIPIARGEADVGALRAGLEALEKGYILGIAPESTRSHDGRLLPGHPGTTIIALRSGAPILPVVHHGDQVFWPNLKKLRRTPFHFVVGHPFYLRQGEERVTRAVRQRMTDEIMYQMAALLPPPMRGHYHDLSRATETYLEFPPGSGSNLVLAAGKEVAPPATVYQPADMLP